MDKQIDEMQQSIAQTLGEIELLVIEDKKEKEKALDLIRTTKKELSDDCNLTDNSKQTLI